MYQRPRISHYTSMSWSLGPGLCQRQVVPSKYTFRSGVKLVAGRRSAGGPFRLRAPVPCA